MKTLNILPKREKFLKYSQLTHSKTKTTSTTDSNGGWWKKPGATRSVPSQFTDEEKSAETNLVKTASSIKNEPRKAMEKTAKLKIPSTGSTLPQLRISGRIRNSLSSDIPTLLSIPNRMDCKTPASHRGSTLIEQRLNKKLNENHYAKEQTTLHDVLDDADTNLYTSQQEQ